MYNYMFFPVTQAAPPVLLLLQVPASALSPKELAAWSEEGELVPKYVDIEVETVSQYYKVGDEIDAFVLEYNDQGKMALTQYADWEIEAMAMDAPLVEEMVGDLANFGTLGDFSGKEMDVLSSDPLELVEEAGGMSSASAFDDLSLGSEGEQNSAVVDFSAFGRGSSQYTSALFTTTGDIVNPTAFPSRPLVGLSMPF